MSKFNLSVCPHDTAKNILGWYFLNTYLQRNLEMNIHFEPKDSFIKEREDVLLGGYHIVYANPFSAAMFCKTLGFVPVARPVGVFDETILVAKAGQGIPTHRPIKIASGTDKLIVHNLGLTLLNKLDIAVKDCEFQFVGTHIKAAQAVMQGKADLGFVFNETWLGMSQSNRSELEVLEKTEDKHAFHCFCVSSDLSDKREQVLAVLTEMTLNPKGLKVLEDLKFTSGFEEVTPEDLEFVVTMLNLNDNKSHGNVIATSLNKSIKRI